MESSEKHSTLTLHNNIKSDNAGNLGVCKHDYPVEVHALSKKGKLATFCIAPAKWKTYKEIVPTKLGMKKRVWTQVELLAIFCAFNREPRDLHQPQTLHCLVFSLKSKSNLFPQTGQPNTTTPRNIEKVFNCLVSVLNIEY